MIKVIVCRVGEEPKVEEVEDNVVSFAHGLLKGGYIESKTVKMSSDLIVVVYQDEEARMKRLPINRDIPAIGGKLPPHNFVIDMRSHDRPYAKPGEMGYFEILGNFLITKHRHSKNVSLTDNEVIFLLPLLAIEKCKRCRVKPLAYSGAKYCGDICAQAEAGE